MTIRSPGARAPQIAAADLPLQRFYHWEATTPDKVYFTQPFGGGKLRDAFESTVDELRHQYTIVYEPTNEKLDGKWRTIEVGISQPQHKARTRSGYFAPKPETKN